MDYEIRWGVETGEAGLGEDGNEVPCIIDLSRVFVHVACPMGCWKLRPRAQFTDARREVSAPSFFRSGSGGLCCLVNSLARSKLACVKKHY